MNRMQKQYGMTAVIIGVLILAACSDSKELDSTPTEILVPITWNETIVVDGEIKAAEKTPLNVPGAGWESRTLVAMVADGSLVKKGQVIARFDAPKSRMDLSMAEAELLRKELAEQAITASEGASSAILGADRAKVDGDLLMSERYAKAELSVFSRNQMLDALQDVGFLNFKRSYLQWKTGQVQGRSAADRGVLSSQKDSVELTAKQQRKNLAELDLIAPHDGVFLLTKSWDDSKPQIGSSERPGEEFGSLPDMDQLIASFRIEEGRTFGLKVGLPVKVQLAGTGSEIMLKITKVGSNASVASSESPVKYSNFEASIDLPTVQKYGLKPGQAINGVVSMIERDKVLTVPNIALMQEGGEYGVMIKEGAIIKQRKVQLGVRGAIRSEIKAGLNAGMQLVLIPEKKEKKS